VSVRRQRSLLRVAQQKFSQSLRCRLGARAACVRVRVDRCVVEARVGIGKAGVRYRGILRSICLLRSACALAVSCSLGCKRPGL